VFLLTVLIPPPEKANSKVYKIATEQRKSADKQNVHDVKAAGLREKWAREDSLWALHKNRSRY
jgi:hypothetical protein